MKNTLYIKQIADYYKSKKNETIHSRRVEISDEAGTIKVIFNDEFGDLPSKIRNLDENADIDAEVEVDIEFYITSKQRKIDSSFKKEVGKKLKEEGYDVEVL